MHFSSICRRRVGHDPLHAYRLGDVLDRLLAQPLQAEGQLVPDLLLDGGRKADAARFGRAFQARRHVDPVAIDIAWVDNDMAEVELQPAAGTCLRTKSTTRAGTSGQS